MYHDTETAVRADIVLPAAAWGEKEGTFINSERRIGLLKKVRRAPGQALADFHIFQLVAKAWGVDDLFTDWDTPESVFQILKKLSVGRPCDISGIEDYVALEKAGGLQWPYPKGADFDTNQRRLFEDGRYYTEDGKAKFLFSEPEPLPEAPDTQFPLVLLTGRGSSSQWHTQTRTKRSKILSQLAPSEAYVEISPVDARELGLSPEQMVTVTSRRASVQARAFITNTVRPGHVFMPMHYDTMNRLTMSSFDPHSRQPAYKACAVRVAETRHT
jgi:assimilatory nitrate reductase catalytic subunit